jgi:hypothetical protein
MNGTEQRFLVHSQMSINYENKFRNLDNVELIKLAQDSIQMQVSLLEVLNTRFLISERYLSYIINYDAANDSINIIKLLLIVVIFMSIVRIQISAIILNNIIVII